MDHDHATSYYYFKREYYEYLIEHMKEQLEIFYSVYEPQASAQMQKSDATLTCPDSRLIQKQISRCRVRFYPVYHNETYYERMQDSAIRYLRDTIYIDTTDEIRNASPSP